VKTIAIALSIWVAAVAYARVAHADDSIWKDGCPGKIAPEFRPRDLPDLPTHNGVAAFGPTPDLDSALGPTRVALGTWVGSLAPQNMGTARPENLFGQQALVQFDAGTTGPIAMGTMAWGDAYSHGGDAGSYAHLANAQFYVGYRKTSYLLRPAFRRGWAIRLGAGSAFGANNQHLVDEREYMAVLAPFRSQLFGFERPMTATLEYRIEMIGCHGPFLHARIDASTWVTQLGDGRDFPRIYVVPMSLAGGGFIYPQFALYGQFGIEFRSPQSIMMYSHITRTSLGVEFQSAAHHAHLGLRGSAFAGDNARGLELTLNLAGDLLL
jgi:hypothetical protein